jgi:hypothetical protein
MIPNASIMFRLVKHRFIIKVVQLGIVNTGSQLKAMKKILLENHRKLGKLFT